MEPQGGVHLGSEVWGEVQVKVEGHVAGHFDEPAPEVLPEALQVQHQKLRRTAEACMHSGPCSAGLTFCWHACFGNQRVGC